MESLEQVTAIDIDNFREDFPCLNDYGLMKGSQLDKLQGNLNFLSFQRCFNQILVES